MNAEEASQFASAFLRASISDLLCRFAEAKCSRVLLFAPPTEEAHLGFEVLLQELGVESAWQLQPVLSSSDPLSSDLGAILADGARKTRALCSCEHIVFIGADCPDLPLSALVSALDVASADRAYICPAHDGGYVLLALPAAAEAGGSFRNVHWSAADTCESQRTALDLAGISSCLGPTFADVDEVEDLAPLYSRLQADHGGGCSCDDRTGDDGSGTSAPVRTACPHTSSLLVEWSKTLDLVT